jgi:hypothetical protein
MDWNAIAVLFATSSARPGQAGAIDIATVHAAIYDSIQSIERDYEPYRVQAPNASGSPIAAAAKAARDVLVARFPAQANDIHTLYVNYLVANGIDDDDPGITVGAYVAEKLLASRSCDGSLPVPMPSFAGSTGIGAWRPTPPANSFMHPGPYLGQVTPFTLTRSSQFRSDPPPTLESRRYARDYEEVRLYGAVNGSLRSPEQTALAQFWRNVLPSLNGAVRDLALAKVTNVSDCSRLFALVTMANADATIGVWDDKSHYVFWRPITAIQNGDVDNNPNTQGEVTWTPLVPTPPYPDYTSGACGYTAATMQALTDFFGTDNMEFSITTASPAGQVTRHYKRFSQAVDEVVDARVFLGIHFRFADEAGRDLGQKVAKWIHKSYMRPVGGGK